MKHLDVTFDLETVSTSTNAAIVEIAAMPWNRYDGATPFFDRDESFVAHVDLNSALLAGFDVDEQTVRWWKKQDPVVRESVFGGDKVELPEVLDAFSSWMEELKSRFDVRTISLWCQGSDFDIAILKTAYARYGKPFPLDRAFFRDARTYILDIAPYLFCGDEPIPALRCPEQTYSRLPELKNIKQEKHNPLYDCKLTTWQVWNVMKRLQHYSQQGGAIIK